MNKLNSHGEATYPCLTPLRMSNQSVYAPFILTQAQAPLCRDRSARFSLLLLTPSMDKPCSDHFRIVSPTLATWRLIQQTTKKWPTLTLTLRSLQLERVAAVNTSAAAEGWLELNVTGALAAWLGSPADNRGFFITVTPHSQPERDMKPEDIGLEEVKYGVSGSDEKQPFLVAYFKGGPRLGADADAGARRKREARYRRTQGYSDNYVRNPLTGTRL
ncbi:Protein 60A [Eumeta japonica]|uniref:Protein 60A n=1 Tax=Eumeta variegata TaxID=151549 RepID=A0A4C1ZPU5_EUMVA|nr:Protein 60A [Eumeta japonica]